MTATIPREWIAAHLDVPYGALPPDLTPDGPHCQATYPGRHFVCTRSPGHTRRHAAGTGRRIVAVWGDER